MDFTVDKNIDIESSHYMGVTHKKIHSILGCFGQPSCRGMEADELGKVKVQWRIKFADGTIATIYDWKTDKLFHIGGYSPRALKLVKEILGEA